MLLNILELTEDKAFPVSCKKKLVVPLNYNLTSNEVDLDFNGEIILHAGIYILRGIVTTSINCSCDVCLLDMNIPLEFDITEEFSNNDTDNMDVWKFSGKVIDITEPLLVNLLLNIPMKFFCNDDCKGLCQICGTNLNYGSCNCKVYRHSQFDCLDHMRSDDREV